jgi:hypothetical protein
MELCRRGHSFKVQCLGPCGVVTDESDIANANHTDYILVGSEPGDIPSDASFIYTNKVQKIVKFNTIIFTIGTDITHQSDGSFIVNDTGLYTVSYEIAWNYISWLEGEEPAAAFGTRFSQIVINPEITNANQVYGSSTMNVDNHLIFEPNMQNGTATILLSTGDIVCVQAFTDNGDSPYFTSIVSKLESVDPLDAAFITRIQIHKIK